MPAPKLFPYQDDALELLRSGSILCGGVGSGKSITAMAYYYVKECGGGLVSTMPSGLKPMAHPKDLYIITTAKKRDSLDWEKEALCFGISSKKELNNEEISLKIDSWNNINKYENVKNAFFIFDEQRLVGSGAWVKAFLKIAKSNNWILLSATPGDTWFDYLPVFIANGFYKSRKAFIDRHVVYSRYAKFPKVEKYVECGTLNSLKEKIIVYMDYSRSAIAHQEIVNVDYNRELTKLATVRRWHPYENRPIRDIAELCQVLRKITNTDPSRQKAFISLLRDHDKVIIFYNYNYELDILRNLCEKEGRVYSEWNGHKHEQIPKTEVWAYLVQYTAGAEGWNCIETDTIIFYSQNYSYKIMAQASGRIDRLNTPFKDLYYYNIRSSSPIDNAVAKALEEKRTFNERHFRAQETYDPFYEKHSLSSLPKVA